MGPLMSLCFNDIFSLSMCAKTKIKERTQVGAQRCEDNNGDDDNDHGEEWMENPLIYNKVLGWYRKWKIIK